MVEGTVINFGKHKGETWESLVNGNPGYIVWYDKNVRDPQYRNCPQDVIKAAYKVLDMRNYVDPYWGTRPCWDWDHPDYTNY